MAAIRLHYTFSRDDLGASEEPQLMYLLLEATPDGITSINAKMPLNLCLVIDRSSSMRGERLMQVKEAARRIVDQLGNKDYFALITFNDRAEVVIPSQRVLDKIDLKQRISSIEAAGGTEMATGLSLAVQEQQRTAIGKVVSRIILLTDGRTYGDESRCVQIVRRAQARQIGLTALGVGNEWNEDLLETMSSSENSRAHFITSTQEIGKVFAEEVQRMHSIFAQNVQLHVRMRRGGILRSFDRVGPFLASVQITEEQDEYWVARLGDWPSHEGQIFLLEFLVPPLDVGEHPLTNLMLQYHLPGEPSKPQPIQSRLNIRVVPRDDIESDLVNPQVKHWLERLVAYRLQLRAWDDLERGDVKGASTRLDMASTRLFEAGEDELARMIKREATQMLRSGHTSSIGRKQIKYGTRGLMSRSNSA